MNQKVLTIIAGSDRVTTLPQNAFGRSCATLNQDEGGPA